VKKKGSKPGRIVLKGALTLRTIDETRAALRDGLARHSSIEIDCGDATEVDLAAIQILLAARKSALNAKKAFTLSAPASGPLREALQRGGFLGDATDSTAPADSFWLKGTGA
jgi:anti-anti-sigma regulatory factor